MKTYCQGRVLEEGPAAPQPGAEALTVGDASGSVSVVFEVPPPGAALDALLPGDYILVIGPLAETAGGRPCIKSHKVVDLSGDDGIDWKWCGLRLLNQWSCAEFESH